MFDTLGIVLPLFIIIAAGAGVAQSRLLSERVTDALSEFVFVVAIPILLFRTLATATLPEAQPLPYWLAYFGALGITWLIAGFILRRMSQMGAQELTIAGFSAVQSNTVFFGIPLVLRAFGEAAVVPMFLLIAVHLPITMTIATVFVERSDGGRGMWLGMARKLIGNPILVGIFAGVAWRLTGVALPESLGSATKMMADAAAPTALFAMGMTLKRYGLSAPVPQVAVISCIKLLLLPALVYLLAIHVFPMPRIWAAVAVLFAASPCGVNAYLLAQRYKIGVALTSSAIALSTVLGVVSTTFWVWVVKG
jgi:malonate transporter and related proteins